MVGQRAGIKKGESGYFGAQPNKSKLRFFSFSRVRLMLAFYRYWNEHHKNEPQITRVAKTESQQTTIANVIGQEQIWLIRIWIVEVREVSKKCGCMCIISTSSDRKRHAGRGMRQKLFVKHCSYETWQSNFIINWKQWVNSMGPANAFTSEEGWNNGETFLFAFRSRSWSSI